MRDEYDFSEAKRAKDVPHLAKLQAEAKDKIMITLTMRYSISCILRQKLKELNIKR